MEEVFTILKEKKAPAGYMKPAMVFLPSSVLTQCFVRTQHPATFMLVASMLQLGGGTKASNGQSLGPHMQQHRDLLPHPDLLYVETSKTSDRRILFTRASLFLLPRHSSVTNIEPDVYSASFFFVSTWCKDPLWLWVNLMA
jgi:hypothetical protein